MCIAYQGTCTCTSFTHPLCESPVFKGQSFVRGRLLLEQSNERHLDSCTLVLEVTKVFRQLNLLSGGGEEERTELSAWPGCSKCACTANA